MGDDWARLVFADPPYNVPIDGHVGGLGAIRHREFACASGEISRAEFTCFLTVVFKRLAGVTVDGAIDRGWSSCVSHLNVTHVSVYRCLDMQVLMIQAEACTRLVVAFVGSVHGLSPSSAGTD